MSSSENEDDSKRIYRQLEPLCLFSCPNNATDGGIEEESYVADKKERELGKEESEKVGNRKWLMQRGKQEMWLRRRREVGMKRKKRILEAGKHLKSYLLMSVKPNGDYQKVYVPYLVEALETVKDAWPPNEVLPIGRYPDENETSENRILQGFTMIEDKPAAVPSSTRRLSMPEEYMRRYFLKKIIPSEESETNQTVPDASSVSSKDLEDGSVRGIPDSMPAKKETQVSDGKKNFHVTNMMNEFGDTFYTSGKKSDGGKKRVTQNEYNSQGKGIIKLKTKERGSQTGRYSGRSETSPTAKEDTEDSRTSESLPSSSPVELPLQDNSTSGNLSSESEDVKCTCAELSSKETSTDLFRSGNSTLSQTVSEKSVSTQDSTVSIHSVSTGGSTLSTNSNSSSPEIFAKMSAKETSSAEHTHREKIKRNSQFKSFHRILRRGYPKFMRKRPYCRRHFRRKRICYEITEEKETRDDCTDKENCEAEVVTTPSWRRTPVENVGQEREIREDQNGSGNSKYEWVKYTPEEIYMVQQMRHKKFIENYRRFSVPLPATPDTRSITVCAAKGSVYKPSEYFDDHILIPRYSALPRTLSMIVNTSSGDTSAINSDSDSISLADSLEEFPVTHMHQIPYDTKNELKPVRGDVNAMLDIKKNVKRRHPRAKAFFVSIKEPYGEDELLAGITKIPEPPDKIKERINERQLNILLLRKKNLERKRDETKKKSRSDFKRKTTRMRDRKSRPKRDDSVARSTEVNGNANYLTLAKHSDRKFDQEHAASKTQRNGALISPNKKKSENIHKSKTSQEREIHKRVSSDGKDIEYKMHSSKKWNIAGQIATNSEVNETETVNSSLAKPQAVIHPSQMPTSEPEILDRTHSVNQSRPYKYRQKFEVIPEEKSSSISSTEENKTNEANRKPLLPMKIVETPSLPENPKKYTLGNVSNLVFAKFMGRSLKACVHKGSSSERPIILLSPKAAETGPNSRKGRDALLALNREDFNRLSKGWMNFYLLKETSDASESSYQEENEDWKIKVQRSGNSQNERKTDSKQESDTFGEVKTSDLVITEKEENNDLMSLNVRKDWRSSFREGELESIRKKSLNDSVRLYSSNTVLKPIKITPRRPEKRLSLPELNVSSSNPTALHQQSPNKNRALILPKVPHKTLECDGMDSDSTVYCQPPSSIVPRLAFRDSGDSEGSLSNSESDETTMLPLKLAPPRRRGSNRRGPPKREVKRDSQEYSGWSVTVAGTLELSAAAPDLEMRLSFPGNGCGPPQAIQSDSGFVEDVLRVTDVPLNEPVTSDGSRKQRWTITVQNPKQGYADETERKASRNHTLPELGQTQSRNMKKVLKNQTQKNEITDRKISIFWPKLEVRRDDWMEEMFKAEELSVRGNAIPLEAKPRPPTMTERDLTRGFTARSSQSDSRYPGEKKPGV